MWRWQFSKRSYGTAMGLGLSLLIGTTGCVRLTHHLTRHTPVHELKTNGGYYHCPSCGQVIEARHGHQCAIQLPYHGFQPTCWMPWQEGWPGCPTVVEEKLMPAEVLPGAAWEPKIETSQQPAAGSPSARLLVDAGGDSMMLLPEPPHISVQVPSAPPSDQFQHASVIAPKESLPTPIVPPKHVGQQVDDTDSEPELAVRPQRVSTWPADQDLEMPSDSRNQLVAEQSSHVDRQNETDAAAQEVVPEVRVAEPDRTVSLTLVEAVARWLPDSTSSTSPQAAEVQYVPEDRKDIALRATKDSSSSETDANSTPNGTSIAEYFEMVIPEPKNTIYKPVVEHVDEAVAGEVRTGKLGASREDEPNRPASPSSRKPKRRPTLVETLFKLGSNTTEDSSNR